MVNNLKTQIHTVAMTRSLVDLETSLLLTIKSNLENLMKEEIEGVDEMTKQVIRGTWKAEIKNIEMELINRN
jgi:hypothetical protein